VGQESYIFALGSDHAGYKYKELIKKHLIEKGYDVKDFGTYSEERVDYPDYVRPAAIAVARGECTHGIVFGGSGNGEAMTANKVKGVRCAVCWSEYTARMARAHNNANMISIGERTIPEDLAKIIVDEWIKTRYEGGRHQKRVDSIELSDTEINHK
jgi:ribose 5-phosphate isomerase B